jgi:hypothetical protein
LELHPEDIEDLNMMGVDNGNSANVIEAVVGSVVAGATFYH